LTLSFSWKIFDGAAWQLFQFTPLLQRSIPQQIEPTSWREYRGKFEFPDAGAQRKRSRAHRTPERKYITKRGESNRNDAAYIYVYMDSCRGGKIVLPD